MKLTRAKLGLLLLFLLSIFQLSPSLAQAQCGGTERWAVKVGTDPAAANVDLGHPVTISLQDLIGLQEPSRPPAGDNSTRLDQETHVYVVRGRLVEFKFETDNDYHMVITDDTLDFTTAHSTTASGHSFIAEIPDPNCIPGKHGAPSVQSAFISGIQNARGELEAQFPNIDKSGAFNDAGGIPVQIVGVGFFDFPHGQVGRAPNNIEIHPVLDITFNPPAASTGTLTLNAAPTALTVAQGGTVSATVSTAVGGGLNSAITLATGAPPAGTTATFNPSSIAAPGSGSSTLTIVVGSSTPPRTFALPVSGSGGGVSGSTTISLTVTPAPVAPTSVVTAPADGSSVSGLVSLTATGTDSVGVVNMELYVDGNLKACNFGATSIAYPWDTMAVANGTHTIVSKAYNAAGGVGTSQTVTVTVTNQNSGM